MIKSVNTFLIKDNSVCLGMKKIGHGKGFWNGFGGKVEVGESFEDAAIREVEEESHVTIKPENIFQVGDMYYHDAHEDWDVKVFVAEEWEGIIAPSNEMDPKWFEIDMIPYEKMHPNDKIWLPKVMNKQPYKLNVWLDINGEMTKYEVEEI